MEHTAIYDEMRVHIAASNEAVGANAAQEVAEIMRATVAQRGEASIILATGNSQLSFIKALSGMPEVPWDRISIFHMDEYIGMSPDHPASFRRYMREKLVDLVHPRAFYGIIGEAPEVEREMDRYAALLHEHQPICCVLGIGENGHLAFNDPPADFHTDEMLAVVTMDGASRRQQVGEGHFARISEVPDKAITLTIPALLAPAHVLAVVPEARKAEAVKRALEGPVTPDCPASILRTFPHVITYLDRASASLLTATR